jgi:hypothetical protein
MRAVKSLLLLINATDGSPHSRSAVALQLLQDGYTLKGTNSLGALQIVLPDGSGGGGGGREC